MRKIYILLFVMMVSVGSLYSQWANTGIGDLNDVTFVKGSSTEAYAVGQNGMVYYSSTSGATWSQLSGVPSNKMLLSVSFPTSSDGYIAEDYRILKKSGASWTVLNPGFSDFIKKVYFLDKDTGFVSVNWEGIYRTNNGGSTWTQVINTSQYLNDIFFINAQTGYVVGNSNTVFKTSNAGRTWMPDTVMGNLQSVFFTDINTGYIADNMQGYVYKTINAGGTWTQMNVGPMLGKIAFFGPMNGVVLSMNGAFFKYDGISTWTPDTLKGVSMISSIATGPFGTGKGIMVGMGGTIAITANGGTTPWTILNSAPQNVNGIAFTTASSGFIGGSNGTIYKTTDGAASIQPAYKAPVGGFDFTKIQFVDANNGFALTNMTQIYKTVNSGVNWSPVNVPGSSLSGMAFGSATVGITADWSYNIYVTKDGGNSYHYRNNFSPNVFRDIENIPGSPTSYIMVSNNFIYRTVDTGMSANPVHSDMNSTYNDAFAVNSSVVYVCGRNMSGWGIILRSTDGGFTFTDSLNIGYVNELKSIYFADANNGYAVGSGVILKLTNGGNTITQVPATAMMGTLNTVTSNGGAWYAGGTSGVYQLLSLTVTPDTMKVEKGAPATLSITGTGSWKTFTDKTFITTSPATGSGNGTITVSAPNSLLKEADSAFLYVTTSVGTTIAREVLIARIRAQHELLSFSRDTAWIEADSISQMMAESLMVYVTSSRPLTITGYSNWMKTPWLQFMNSFQGKWMYRIDNIKATNNTSAAPRNGFITLSGPVIGSQDLTIIQKGVQPFFYTDVAGLTIPVGGQKDTIHIFSNTTWSVKVSHPWVSVDKPSGSNNGTVIVTTPANTLSWQRAAFITVVPSMWQPFAIPVIQEGTGSGTVTCSHSAQILNTNLDTICSNDSIILVANSGVGYIYQWFVDGLQVQGGITPNLTAHKSGTYVVGITSNNCTVLSSPMNIAFFPTVEIPVIEKKSGNIAPCSGGSIVLRTSKAFSAYEWSDGSKADTLKVSESGLFKVATANANGCRATSLEYEINASEASKPEICLVNVDRMDNKNTIIWKRATNEKIKSYIIYKETTKAGEYKPMDTVAYNEFNFVVDVHSNPEIQSNRYRVSAIDSCDVESPLSIIHKTLHLTLNQRYGGGVNLIWENYEGLDINSYYIYHGDSPTTMELLSEVPSNIFTYTILTNMKLYYQIGIALPAQCDITKIIKSESGPYSQSLSNIAEYKGLSMVNTSITGVSAYPNPFAEAVSIQYTLNKASDVRIEFVNAIGQKVAEQKLDDQDAGLYVQTFEAAKLNMAPGLYTIRIIIGDEIETLKVICR